MTYTEPSTSPNAMTALYIMFPVGHKNATGLPDGLAWPWSAPNGTIGTKPYATKNERYFTFGTGHAAVSRTAGACRTDPRALTSPRRLF
jgi:hypothetical protein